MSKRPLLLGLGTLLAGVVLGALLVMGLRYVSGPDADTEVTRSSDAARTGSADVRRPTVQIGNPDPPPPLAMPELNSLNHLFRTVAARVTPTVVFIEVESPSDARSRELEEAHPFIQPRRFRRSAGSGVIISADGYIITNAHVIQSANRIGVLLNDKREYEAEVVGVDRTTDLAVIRAIDASGLPVATLGDSNQLEVGEWVLAVGNPFRLTSTVTAGIVSALGRQVDIIEDTYRIEDFIQTDAAINPGNSGGALVNMQGELVGIATAIATESGSYEGYGFAVPTRLVVRVAEDLIEFGDVQRGYLGVTIRGVTALDAQRQGLERIGGVVVDEVFSDGSAARAGLREGDIVLQVDGEAVDATSQFQSAIALRRPGETVTLSIWRRGSVRDIEADLIGRDDDIFRAWAAESGMRQPPPRSQPAPRGQAPQPEQRLFEPEPWGVGLRDLTDDDRYRFGVDAGAYVVYVRPGAPAAADGLPSQSVVVEIEGQEVRDARQAMQLLEQLATSSESALLRVRRADGVAAFYDLESPLVEG